MELPKKKILILTEWYLPGRNSGGPVKSIESFVWAMKSYFDIFILTSDTDLGESNPYSTIQTDTWMNMSDGSTVMYLQKRKLSFSYIHKKLTESFYDFVYINGIYNKWFSIIPLQIFRKLDTKSLLVIAPRGMLSRGAISIKSFKKKIFIKAANYLRWYNSVRWHASSEIEAKEIRDAFGDNSNIYIAGNFSKQIYKIKEGVAKKKNELKLFFLSRISPVKNLHIALEALNSLKDFSGNIVYDIYGRREDYSYVRFCNQIIQKMNSTITVSFKGEIDNNFLGEVLPNYHFLFLPTGNENFGHSIFESFQCGCPVIISNRTPWRNLQQLGCGWDVEPRSENFHLVLKSALEMDDTAYKKMKDSAIRLAIDKMNDVELVNSTLKVFS